MSQGRNKAAAIGAGVTLGVIILALLGWAYWSWEHGVMRR